MDTDTLVEEWIDAGQMLLDRLAAKEIHVAAASWIKTSEEGVWFLYIATDLVDLKGLAVAYSEVYRLLRTVPNSWISTSDIKLIGTDDPVTEDLCKLQDRFSSSFQTRSRSLRLASIGVEEIYLYRLKNQSQVPLRQSISVSYHRQGDSNTWDAKTELGKLYRGSNAKGAIGYSTAYWEGEVVGSEKHATVTVLLEVLPESDGDTPFIDPCIEKVWVDQARKMSDEMFIGRHPGAEIRHKQ